MLENGVGNGRSGGHEAAEAVVVKHNDGDRRRPLLPHHSLVGRDEGREAALLRFSQKFVIRERVPVMLSGGLDCDTAELLLEALA